MRALIVDDDKQMRCFIELLLREMVAVDTVEASNGKEAFALLKCESADLIISDWSMPVMDGLELLKACKGDAALKHIPFIMSSGQGEKADILRAIEAGVDAYIVKTFLPNELQDVLDKIMVKTDQDPAPGGVSSCNLDYAAEGSPATKSDVPSCTGARWSYR